MSNWSYTSPPNWKSNPGGSNNYIPTAQGWVNSETKEIVVAIPDLIARQGGPVVTTVILEGYNGSFQDPFPGQMLIFDVTFSQLVDVTGSPYIQLSMSSGTVNCVYSNGSGTNTLSFSYTIQETDFGYANGINLITPIVLNGGTIASATGANAQLSFTSPDLSQLYINF